MICHVLRRCICFDAAQCTKTVVRYFISSTCKKILECINCVVIRGVARSLSVGEWGGCRGHRLQTKGATNYRQIYWCQCPNVYKFNPLNLWPGTKLFFSLPPPARSAETLTLHSIIRERRRSIVPFSTLISCLDSVRLLIPEFIFAHPARSSFDVSINYYS